MYYWPIIHFYSLDWLTLTCHCNDSLCFQKDTDFVRGEAQLPWAILLSVHSSISLTRVLSRSLVSNWPLRLAQGLLVGTQKYLWKGWNACTASKSAPPEHRTCSLSVHVVQALVLSQAGGNDSTGLVRTLSFTAIQISVFCRLFSVFSLETMEIVHSMDSEPGERPHKHYS